VPQSQADALEAGDLVWLDFGPPFGQEQAGRRPAIVVSPKLYNERSSLVLVCPITRNVSAWAFKVEIPAGTKIQGAIVVDQVRSINRRLRFVRRVGHVGAETLARVYGTFASLLGIPVSN
jgi:mRNA interferase MazF